MSVSLQPWTFHPVRDFLISEAHARPPQNVSGPAQIIHIAFRANSDIYWQFFKTIRPSEDPAGLRHVSGNIDQVHVKIEQHTEFMSCSLFQNNTQSDAPVDLAELLAETFPVKDVEVFALIRLDVLSQSNSLSAVMSVSDRIYGGVLRKAIDVRSSFIPDAAGFIRFVLHPGGLTPDELGRRLQRLIEMETYRTMALLGLPAARAVSGELSKIEHELEDLTRLLRGSSENSRQESERLFEHLSILSERTNVLAANTRYRFAASRAYATLFDQRLDSLEEEKVSKLQTISGFLRSRFEPAIATIESTATRQTILTNDLSRALNLLRTRIDLDLAKGDQALLKSMDKRHDQQLKISQTVEGLSIVAITYYAVGLMSYLLKALAQQPWMPVSSTVMTAISVPFILMTVWFMLRRVRKAWEDKAT